MSGDYLLPLDGIKGESSDRAIYPTLALLVADLRLRSKGHVLTSVAHGARSVGRDRVRDDLRRLGVVERYALDAKGTADTALGFIVLQAQSTAGGRAQPIPVLMVIADQRDFSRGLLTEQKQLRDAQRHFDLPASCRIVAGTGSPVADKDHDKWVVLNAFSN